MTAERAPTGAPPSHPPDARRLRRVVPANVKLDTSRRLGIASFAIGVVLLLLIGERFLGYLTSDTWVCIDGLTVVLSFALSAACHRRKIPLGLMLGVATAYELLIALTLSYMEFSVPNGAMHVRQGGISWACLVIVLFPALVPTPPLKALAAGFCAASMGPLAYTVAVALGEEPHPLPHYDMAMLFLDNYIAGALAIVPSLVFTQLAADAADARDLGSYTLDARLGVGGMGEVWRAHHRLLARPAAVKLIRPSPGKADADLNALARFEREARATAGLRSPHTVVLYDFGTADDGAFYYVMELLEGLDVEALVERFGPIAPARAVWLLMQACESLEEAHQAGLVHRDVKPANLYVCHLGTQYDFIKILDFGLVKTASTDGPEAVKLSRTSLVYGTPAYMAPEQARGETVTPHTDIYALGCVAYYMLTGVLVFEERATTQVLIDHVQTTPVPPSKRVNKVLPPELEALVMQCLEKAPEKRPQSAREVFDRLAAIALPRPWSARQAEAWWAQNLPGKAPTAAPAAVATH